MATGFYRRAAALPLPALRRAPRPLPGRRPRQGRPPAPGAPARHPRPRHGPPARLVPAARRRRHRPGGLPAPRHHPAPGRHVPLLGFAERLAPPYPRREPALRPRPGLGRARLRARRLGRRRLAARPHHRPGRPHGRAEPATVWTWNAIGKRPGAWALDPAPPRPPAASSSTTSSRNAAPERHRSTPIPSPARPPGTTSASASSASPPAAAPLRVPAAGLPGRAGARDRLTAATRQSAKCSRTIGRAPFPGNSARHPAFLWHDTPARPRLYRIRRNQRKARPMLKHLLASAALGALLATGALAQTAPAADPAADPATTAPADPMTPAPVELTGDWVVDENYSLSTSPSSPPSRSSAPTSATPTVRSSPGSTT